MPLDEVSIRTSIDKINNMKMINNNVLVEVFDTRGEVNGIKILITQDNPFVPDRGIVCKKPDNVTCFNIGDCVIIEKYRGRRVYSDNDRQFLLLDASHILAVVEPEEADLVKYADNGSSQQTLQSAT